MKKWEYMIVRAVFNYEPTGPRGLKNARILAINDKTVPEWHHYGIPTSWENFFYFLEEAGRDGWELINLTDSSGEGKTFVFKRELIKEEKKGE